MATLYSRRTRFDDTTTRMQRFENAIADWMDYEDEYDDGYDWDFDEDYACYE